MHRLFVAGWLILTAAIAPATADTPTSKAAPLIARDLQGIAGKEAAMLLVECPPGGADPVHRHNASVFVYMLDGSMVMQVRGGPEVTLTKGQVFFEGPDDIHTVGRNASKTEPARFLAFFVKDKGAPALVPAQ